MKQIKKSIAFFSALLLICSSYASTAVNNGCLEWAADSAENESIYYGGPFDEYEYMVAVVFYYNACNEAGGSGNIGDPVFL